MANDDKTKEKGQLAGELTKKETAPKNAYEKFLAANPDIMEAVESDRMKKLETLKNLQNQFNYIYEQEKKLKDIMGNTYEPRESQLKQMMDLSDQMNNIISGAGDITDGPKAPGTVTIGEGDNAIELSEDRLNKMLNDPNVMQQELANMPPDAVDKVAEYLGVQEINQGLQQPTQQEALNPAPASITPVPSNQVGGIDSLKSTIKNFMTQFGMGKTANAAETVENVSAQAKSATRKGIV